CSSDLPAGSGDPPPDPGVLPRPPRFQIHRPVARADARPDGGGTRQRRSPEDPMTQLPYPVYDADNHLYEPEEAFLRHLPKKFEEDSLSADIKGRKQLVIGGRLSEHIPNPTLEVVAGPGTHEQPHRAPNPERLSPRG